MARPGECKPGDRMRKLRLSASTFACNVDFNSSHKTVRLKGVVSTPNDRGIKTGFVFGAFDKAIAGVNDIRHRLGLEGKGETP